MALPNPLQEAHKHSIHNRREILSSDNCSCFYCLAIFPPHAILDWINDDPFAGTGMTGLCPECGIDSVIGSHSVFPINQAFLAEMRKLWFE